MSRPRPTAKQYQDWRQRIVQLRDEVEIAHGDNAAGTYPHELEMTLLLAWGAARRAQEDAEREPEPGLEPRHPDRGGTTRMSPLPDRRVHATTGAGGEIVRYDRAGKWYHEQTGDPRKRMRIRLAEAARIAALPNSSPEFGIPGGQIFDAQVRRAQAALTPRPRMTVRRDLA